jgi:cellulose synthase (UDP-forming)
MTQGRVLPIMADISQLLGAHTILKAVFVGLVKPVGQKFKVTAKGGDRDVRFVEWSLLRVFLVYLLLTVAGVIAAFEWKGGWSVQDSSAIALFWSWYNIVILTITCFVCIEQPRKRKSERFLSGEQVGVAAGGETVWQPVRDISTTGIRIGGPAPARRGERIEITLGSVLIHGVIVRVTKNDFAVRIEDELEARKAMIRHIYAGRYSASIARVKPRQVLQALLARTFR